jgi:GR25 family glycosyltransferase involved in LPS biosynthesis
MGRPLKIKKIIETGGNGKDIGFNGLLTLTNPVAPSPVWDTTTEYLGVVGGVQPPTIATAAYPIVKCEVNITNSYSGQTAGVIIRQKGARKFMVATSAAIDPANAVVGVALRIATLGNTDWQAMGAPAGAIVGTIFTATAASGAGTSGTAQEVGTCVLSSDLTPTAGNMSISYFSNDSQETAISKLTNKFLQNFAGGCTGGNADTGEVWAAAQVVNNVALADNFYSDEGVTAKSGADVQTWAGTGQLSTGNLDLAIVENYTS